LSLGQTKPLGSTIIKRGYFNDGFISLDPNQADPLLFQDKAAMIFDGPWIEDQPDLGLLNQVLGALGLKALERNWLADPGTAIYPVIVAATWNSVGLPMLLYLAGLQTIPVELLEAAKVEGAGPIRRFLYVTFPLLRETTLIVLAITAINALKAYDIVYAMTNGGPANQTQLLSAWMYFLTYNYNQVGLGTAIAVILFSLTIIFAIPYMRFMTRKT